jgi:hypothetical protein
MSNTEDLELELNGEADKGDWNGMVEEVPAFSTLTVKEAQTFNREQAAALVGMYYSIQKSRVGASNKVSAHNRNVDFLPDTAVIVQLKEQLHKLEKQASRALNWYAKSQPLGIWAMSHQGVGHVFAAGLLAHIDCSKAHTAGGVWRFAGLDPTLVWNKGEKRPYNAALKKLCWLIGESFKKVHAKDDAFYGKLWKERKDREIRYNEEGRFADLARAKLVEADRKRFNIPAEMRKSWDEGKLTKGGLDLRAGRYAVKIFLSHYWQVGRLLMGLPICKPWVIEHGGHVHIINPPNMEVVGLKPA